MMICLPVVLGDDDVDTDAIFCLKILKNLTISANQIQLIIFVVICDIAVNTVITKTWLRTLNSVYQENPETKYHNKGYDWQAWVTMSSSRLWQGHRNSHITNYFITIIHVQCTCYMLTVFTAHTQADNRYWVDSPGLWWQVVKSEQKLGFNQGKKVEEGNDNSNVYVILISQ